MEVRTMLFDPNQDPKLTDSIRYGSLLVFDYRGGHNYYIYLQNEISNDERYCCGGIISRRTVAKPKQLSSYQLRSFQHYNRAA